MEGNDCELCALAKHLEIGRARFDVCLSLSLNLLRTTPMKCTLMTYATTDVEVMKEIELYYTTQLDNCRTNSRYTVWTELVSTSIAMGAYILRETLMKPATDFCPVATFNRSVRVFVFVRQTDQRWFLKFNLEQLVQGIKRSPIASCGKKVFIVMQSLETSSVSRRRHLRATWKLVEPAISRRQFIEEVYRIATCTNGFALGIRTQQITARICDALVALERRKLRKSIAKKEARAVERQEGLTYPTHTLLQLYLPLMALRHHAIECVVTRRAQIARLPKLLSILFKKHIEAQDESQETIELLRRIVRRFTNSTCKVTAHVIRSCGRTWCSVSSHDTRSSNCFTFSPHRYFCQMQLCEHGNRTPTRLTRKQLNEICKPLYVTSVISKNHERAH
eukprot:IDg2202t1